MPLDRFPLTTELGDLFRVLSNPDRIVLVQLLGARGEMKVNELAENAGISPSRTSQHLNLLRASRLVKRTSLGRYRVYSLKQRELADWVVYGVRFVWHIDMAS